MSSDASAIIRSSKGIRSEIQRLFRGIRIEDRIEQSVRSSPCTKFLELFMDRFWDRFTEETFLLLGESFQAESYEIWYLSSFEKRCFLKKTFSAGSFWKLFVIGTSSIFINILHTCSLHLHPRLSSCGGNIFGKQPRNIPRILRTEINWDKLAWKRWWSVPEQRLKSATRLIACSPTDNDNRLSILRRRER